MNTDICILGGGIMGLSTAYNISKKSNCRIVLVDKYGVGNDYCSSNDFNRVFRYSYGSDQYYTRMAVESLRLWRQMEKESGQELLIQSGLVLLDGEDEDANSFNKASYQTLSRMGLGAEELDKRDLYNRYPQFRADRAYFDLHGGVLLASKALMTLRSLAEAKGVKILQGQADMLSRGENRRLPLTDLESIEFRTLVVTVGPWTNHLLRDGLAQIKPTRQQLVYFQPNDLDPYRPGRFPVFFTDKHYGLPASGIDAVKVSAKELTEQVEPDTANRTVDEEQIEQCRNASRIFVPELASSKVVQSKVCLYDMTQNSDFVLDRDPDVPYTIYGYGFSGHGFKFAPLIGLLLAEMVLDMGSSFNLDRFSTRPSNRRPSTTSAHLGKGK